MAILALTLYIAFLVLAFGVRSWLQYRRTKDFGFRSPWKHRDSSGWIGVLFFGLGVILAGSSPVVDLLRTAPSHAPNGYNIAGLLIVLAGFVVTIIAQFQMKDSWRIGVDENEVTPLVRRGLFAHIRNPIFSGMLLAAAGMLLLLPNPLSAAALFCLILGVEFQVRRIEEPYLVRTHGKDYVAYARTTGRFFPRVGRLP